MNRLDSAVVALPSCVIYVFGPVGIESFKLLHRYELRLLYHKPVNSFCAGWCCERSFIVEELSEIHLAEECSQVQLAYVDIMIIIWVEEVGLHLIEEIVFIVWVV